MLPPEQMRRLFEAVKDAKQSPVTWVEFEDAHHMDAYFVAQHVSLHTMQPALCSPHNDGKGCMLLHVPCALDCMPRTCHYCQTARSLLEMCLSIAWPLQEYWPALLEFLRLHGCSKAPGEPNTDSEPEYEDLSGEVFDDDLEVSLQALRMPGACHVLGFRAAGLKHVSNSHVMHIGYSPYHSPDTFDGGSHLHPWHKASLWLLMQERPGAAAVAAGEQGSESVQHRQGVHVEHAKP